MKDKYTEEEVLKSLRRKNDVRIEGKSISVIRGSAARCDLGNGSKGKIDYLSHYCGYKVQWVTEFRRF